MARTPPFTAQQAKELADAVREFPEGTEHRWSRASALRNEAKFTPEPAAQLSAAVATEGRAPAAAEKVER